MGGGISDDATGSMGDDEDIMEKEENHLDFEPEARLTKKGGVQEAENTTIKMEGFDDLIPLEVVCEIILFLPFKDFKNLIFLNKRYSNICLGDYMMEQLVKQKLILLREHIPDLMKLKRSWKNLFIYGISTEFTYRKCVRFDVEGREIDEGDFAKFSKFDVVHEDYEKLFRFSFNREREEEWDFQRFHVYDCPEEYSDYTETIYGVVEKWGEDVISVRCTRKDWACCDASLDEDGILEYKETVRIAIKIIDRNTLEWKEEEWSDADFKEEDIRKHFEFSCPSIPDVENYKTFRLKLEMPWKGNKDERSSSNDNMNAKARNEFQKAILDNDNEK